MTTETWSHDVAHLSSTCEWSRSGYELPVAIKSTLCTQTSICTSESSGRRLGQFSGQSSRAIRAISTAIWLATCQSNHSTCMQLGTWIRCMHVYYGTCDTGSSMLWSRVDRMIDFSSSDIWLLIISRHIICVQFLIFIHWLTLELLASNIDPLHSWCLWWPSTAQQAPESACWPHPVRQPLNKSFFS